MTKEKKKEKKTAFVKAKSEKPKRDSRPLTVEKSGQAKKNLKKPVKSPVTPKLF